MNTYVLAIVYYCNLEALIIGLAIKGQIVVELKCLIGYASSRIIATIKCIFIPHGSIGNRGIVGSERVRDGAEHLARESKSRIHGNPALIDCEKCSIIR